MPFSVAAAALAEALCDDPFYQAVSQSAQDGAARQLMLSRYFAAALDEARVVGQVQIAGQDGAALWLLPSDPKVEAAETARRELALADTIGPAGLATYRAVCAGMAAQVPAGLAGAWYLSILGVRPAARGAGLAQSLLAPTLAAADQAGAVTWLETFNPLSLPFYQRLGFVTVHPLHEPVMGRDYWLLVRPAP